MIKLMSIFIMTWTVEHTIFNRVAEKKTVDQRKATITRVTNEIIADLSAQVDVTHTSYTLTIKFDYLHTSLIEFLLLSLPVLPVCALLTVLLLDQRKMVYLLSLFQISIQLLSSSPHFTLPLRLLLTIYSN